MRTVLIDPSAPRTYTLQQRDSALTSNRRQFLARIGYSTVGLSAAAAVSAMTSAAAKANRQAQAAVIDTHMHVWSGDLDRFPFAHPYRPDFKPPKTAGTLELLLQEMDQFGITACVLVQVIYYGWDNRYTAHCLKAQPKRLRAQGLIDPTDPQVAQKLEFWVREHQFSGMRFSPMYYQGRDDWLNAKSSYPLWRKAEELGAIFNFFITTAQLPKLEEMVRRFPAVRVVIDHLARIDLKAADPLPEFKKLLALAQCPNVWVKVSELSVLSPSQKYPYADTFPWVKRLYEAFGPDRLLWGTGFPGVTRAEAGRPTLPEELALIRTEIPFFTPEDREKILSRNAAKLWRFEIA